MCAYNYRAGAHCVDYAVQIPLRVHFVIRIHKDLSLTREARLCFIAGSSQVLVTREIYATSFTSSRRPHACLAGPHVTHNCFVNPPFQSDFIYETTPRDKTR